MRLIRAVTCLLFVALWAVPCSGQHRSDPDPEPVKPRYHRYFFDLPLPERSPKEISKLLKPLDVALAACATPLRIFGPARIRTGKPPLKALGYGVYIRTRGKSWEQIEAIIKKKPGIQNVGPPPRHPRTYDKIPKPKMTKHGPHHRP